MTEYHWVLTLEIPGRVTTTRSGVFTPGPEDTRESVFNGVRESVERTSPQLTGANTVFWSLEPNQI